MANFVRIVDTGKYFAVNRITNPEINLLGLI